jgi:hypothetical protein
MKNWLKALFSETALSAWWVLSALSTVSTFFLTAWAGRPRLASAISAIIGFAWANFRVFKKHEAQVSALREAAQTQEARVARLIIRPDDGSRYILKPVGNAPHGDFNGIYLELHLMIENIGRRNSTVDNFQVEILNLGRTFSNLRPIEGENRAQGRHCQFGLNPKLILSKTGVIKIGAEEATDHGTLLFFVPAMSLEIFVAAGLHIAGEERRFPPLRGILTVTDTTHSSASGEFQLQES